ncbi:Nre family DNA repair protein [Methanobacterium alcaliphilum]|uniref:Nre family DNA repair protein n=1 Tax=Methanobacterium alcaliphilum TaxID=392018 RepID=UPI00200B49F2|nr:Nre family DNA repair protein [Methanobacterium alcaliphilum]MCK9152110.1 Nre family DNA repair protein [Methanobacterium alcaliphilum]
MIRSKNAYLQKLTANMKMRSVNVGQELDGSTPPSVFIGSWNYPQVYAGPMMVPQQGDTYIMDSPESWIPGQKTQEDIIGYRLSLVRGKQRIGIQDIDNSFVQKLQDISMASKSIDSEAKFNKRPRGLSFSEETTPHGPSAILEKFDIDSVKWDRELEKAFYDTDLKAKDALTDLHQEKVPFSSMQKAFSVGAMGTEKRRRLVPTRWSITACDSTLADYLLKRVRNYNILDMHRVYEFSSLNNYYAVILIPTEWQYEWMEAFIRVLGKEELIFSDYENNGGKKEYSRVGGCYYTCKMGVLDALDKEKIQAGVIVLREAYSGYVPLGVFNVRENIKYAMEQPYTEFEDLKSSLKYVGSKLKIPMSKFVKKSDLLKEVLRSRQTTLDNFFKK